MRHPTECQGKAYHTPSQQNPLQCYRCGQPIVDDLPAAAVYQPDTNQDAELRYDQT